jgi:two-component system, chemotaxis family, response regulator PixG
MTIQANLSREEQDFESLVAQLKEVEKISFSGNLIIQVPSNQSWMLSFSLGYLSQVHGGIDPDRRWQRSLEVAYLNLPLDSSVNQDNNTSINTSYLAQKSSSLEVIFDIIQYTWFNKNRLSYQLIPINNYALRANTNVPLIKIRTILAQALFSWQEWKNAKLSNYFPNKFVQVRLPESLLSITDNQKLQLLLLSIDGNQSLRDLAVCSHKHILEFTTPLLYLLQNDIIFFSDRVDYIYNKTEDLSKREKFYEEQLTLVTSPNICISNKKSLIESQPLVACIDDELLVYQGLEKILTQHGCKSFGLQEPHKIITALIQNKPDLIFLDLIMPAIDGYEICERIRKVSSLQHIPIIILSSRDGSFERERAKLSGANGFLGKPIRSTSVLEILTTYNMIDLKAIA